MIKANVIGNGSFGRFLKKNYFEHTSESNIVVLAIPASAFNKVCEKHKGKYFINVCSVQSETNKICAKWGDAHIGIHPLFGHRSDPKDRRCILTHGTIHDIELFSDCDIRRMSPEKHDKLMAETHLVALEIAEKYAKQFQKNDPFFLPTSAIKLREALYLLSEMPKGTVDSIKSNPFK